jgi:hypothetical protein
MQSELPFEIPCVIDGKPVSVTPLQIPNPLDPALLTLLT